MPRALPRLPPETWQMIFRERLEEIDEDLWVNMGYLRQSWADARNDLSVFITYLTVCKEWKVCCTDAFYHIYHNISPQDILVPLIYEKIRVQRPQKLQTLARLVSAEGSGAVASFIRCLHICEAEIENEDSDAFEPDDYIQSLHTVLCSTSCLRSILIREPIPPAILHDIVLKSANTLCVLQITVQDLDSCQELNSLKVLRELRLSSTDGGWPSDPDWSLSIPTLLSWNFWYTKLGQVSDPLVRWLGASTFNEACEMNFMLPMSEAQTVFLSPLFERHRPLRVSLGGSRVIGAVHALFNCTDEVVFSGPTPSPLLFKAERLPTTIQLQNYDDEHIGIYAALESLLDYSVKTSRKAATKIHIWTLSHPFRWSTSDNSTGERAQFRNEMLHYAASLSKYGIMIIDVDGVGPSIGVEADQQP
jgi:hypothetical protein